MPQVPALFISDNVLYKLENSDPNLDQPLRSIAGSTSSPTLASIAASDHGALPTK